MKGKGNKYGHLSEWEMLRMYEMFGEGKSFREIGSRLKRNVSTVFAIVKWRPKDTAQWYRMSSVQKAEYQYRSRKKQVRSGHIGNRSYRRHG